MRTLCVVILAIMVVATTSLPQLSSKLPEWVYICPVGFFGRLISGRAYFQMGLLLEGILRLKTGWESNKKQRKTLRK